MHMAFPDSMSHFEAEAPGGVLEAHFRGLTLIRSLTLILILTLILTLTLTQILTRIPALIHPDPNSNPKPRPIRFFCSLL